MRSGPGEVSKRQGFRAPLVLEDGDNLWKCWLSNRYKGVHVQVLSAKRADGRFSTAIVFEREGADGKPKLRTWAKHGQQEEEVIETANEIMKGVSDDRLQFRLLDLSEVKGDLDAQLAALQAEGYQVLSIYRTGRKPNRES